MKKALAILITSAFLSTWFAPLSMSFANTHICELTNTLCKNKDNCPLKKGHEHRKDTHKSCYLTVYKSGDNSQPATGQERPMQFCAGWFAGSPMPEVAGFEPQTSLIVKEVSHTPPERPPQTG